MTYSICFPSLPSFLIKPSDEFVEGTALETFEDPTFEQALALGSFTNLYLPKDRVSLVTSPGVTQGTYAVKFDTNETETIPLSDIRCIYSPVLNLTGDTSVKVDYNVTSLPASASFYLVVFDAAFNEVINTISSTGSGTLTVSLAGLVDISAAIVIIGFVCSSANPGNITAYFDNLRDQSDNLIDGFETFTLSGGDYFTTGYAANASEWTDTRESANAVQGSFSRRLYAASMTLDNGYVLDSFDPQSINLGPYYLDVSGYTYIRMNVNVVSLPIGGEVGFWGDDSNANVYATVTTTGQHVLEIEVADFVDPTAVRFIAGVKDLVGPSGEYDMYFDYMRGV